MRAATRQRVRQHLIRHEATLRVRNTATVYESASHSKRFGGWHAPTTTPNAGLLSLTTLRDRSRAATRNDGYAKGAIDKLVTNIIGTGITPLSQADDPDFRRAVQALWLRWTDESDADGLLDWYGQQSQAVRGWLEAGEIFVRLRPRRDEDGLSVPLQVQIIEPELCPHTYDALLPSGNRVRAGVEFTPIGRRAAYWFYRQRPGDPQEIDYSTLRRIPADRVIHVFDPARSGQIRGTPHLTPALVKLLTRDKFDDATAEKQLLSNLFVGFVTRPTATDASEPFDPLTGQPYDTSEDQPFIALKPGLFQELGPGEEVTWSNPPPVGETYADFMRQQLMAASVGHGVPYEVWTGDMRGMNDRLIRVVLNEFRRRIQAWQHQIVAFQLCRRSWLAWLDRVFLSGALPIPVAYVENPEPWARVKWMPQGWPYLHPVQDVQAKKAAIRAGLTSRSAEAGEQGEDAEEIDAQQAADNERADRLGLTYDSDGRTSAQAEPAPAATEDPQPTGVPA